MITHKCPLEIVTATFQFSISITPKPFPFSLFNLPPFFSLSISISFPKLCEPNNFLISISMAPTPSSSAKPNQFGFTPKSNQTHIRTATPQSKHRLNFTSAKPSPNPNSNPNPNPNSVPADHPVEVVGRIRDYPGPQRQTRVRSSGKPRWPFSSGQNGYRVSRFYPRRGCEF
ncbi:hypothetical protein HanRHA438_Chr02g0097471 [Helianthus annuus]|nr:hypothetical protein HanRHA438_Chr02g0097471 [Helianthus annuus]